MTDSSVGSRSAANCGRNRRPSPEIFTMALSGSGLADTSLRKQWLKLIAVLLGLSCPLLADEPVRPRILGVAHISLFAHDYDASRAFYRDFLGFEEPYSLKNSD